MLGDLQAGDLFDFYFTTRDRGVPTTLAGSPAVSVYKANSVTQSIAGITLDVDFDGVTGLTHVRVDTTADGTFYANGNDFSCILTAGTISGVSVVGVVTEDFSLAHRSGMWAVATRTLTSFGTLVADIATAVWGAATRLLTAGTNIVLAKGVGVTGFNDLSAAQVNTEADTALADYDGPTHAELVSEINDVQADIAALIIPTAAAISDAVWEEAIADHSGTVGSTAEALGAAGSAGDPWITALPGAYGAGSAGKIVGDNLNATVSSRAVPGSAMTLTSGERDAVAAALLDLADAVETGVTTRGALRLSLAALAGKVSGADLNAPVFRNAVADSKDRITATTDAAGNRFTITADMT